MEVEEKKKNKKKRKEELYILFYYYFLSFKGRRIKNTHGNKKIKKGKKKDAC